MKYGDAPMTVGTEASGRTAEPARDQLEDVRAHVTREAAHEAEVARTIQGRKPTATPATTPPTSHQASLHHRQQARTRNLRLATAAVLAVFTVWAPMLTTLTPLFPPAVIWTLYAVALAAGLTHLPQLPRRGGLPLVALVALFTTWAASYPLWSAWWPGGRLVVAEAQGLIACALITVAFVLLTGPTRGGVSAMRRLWLLVVAPLALMAVGESVTGIHFSPGAPYGPPAFSPAGPFGNPNNLACVLVVGVGVVLSRMTERISRTYLATLAVTAAVLATLIALTLSRAGLLALGAVTAGAAILALARRYPRAAWPSMRWTIPALILAAAATFVIPPLRRANPSRGCCCPATTRRSGPTPCASRSCASPCSGGVRTRGRASAARGSRYSCAGSIPRWGGCCRCITRSSRSSRSTDCSCSSRSSSCS
ncbi:hypothetical protein GCM10025883_06700 [Mobilicoccus caccae]|uniref:O-antigen ligase n=1 Tax=Mobilicoccus caccae TaxID=1859295 RepID=A0ABQ6IMS0_9MICO|nr:hypothetical protein [Mobilicoccus caccae]GMA38625.1 hypothetical protein GCM10025883_06700 [Mobilicoccus caccae]